MLLGVESPDVAPVPATGIHHRAEFCSRDAPCALGPRLVLGKRIVLRPARQPGLFSFAYTIHRPLAGVGFEQGLVIVMVSLALGKKQHRLVRPRGPVLDRLRRAGLGPDDFRPPELATAL